jgi:hypothetical protein
VLSTASSGTGLLGHEEPPLKAGGREARRAACPNLDGLASNKQGADNTDDAGEPIDTLLPGSNGRADAALGTACGNAYTTDACVYTTDAGSACNASTTPNTANITWFNLPLICSGRSGAAGVSRADLGVHQMCAPDDARKL